MATQYELLDGKRQGISRTYYDNGAIQSEVTFVDDMLHGLVSSWHKNGFKYTVLRFIDGKAEGIELKWNNKGKLHNKLIAYKDGKECSIQSLVVEKTRSYKEELVAAIFNPDRAERFAKRYNMDVIVYLDCLFKDYEN